MFLPFVTTRLLKCNDRLINGLFHSRCLDFHGNNYFETSIFCVRRLQKQDKLLFKIDYAFDKDQTSEIYYVMVKTFLIQLLILRVYMICLLFPSASQLALVGLLQAHGKLSAFEYENKESRESNNGTKR